MAGQPRSGVATRAVRLRKVVVCAPKYPSSAPIAATMPCLNFQLVAGVIAAGWLPALVQAPSGRAAWDLRTTGRQVVVKGHQDHPDRLPSSFHMASVEDTAEECRETGAVSFSSSGLTLMSDRNSHCLANSSFFQDVEACSHIETVEFTNRPSVDRQICEGSVAQCRYDPPCLQEIGIRFQKVYIPHGASITDAFIVFDVDEQPSNGNRRSRVLTENLTVTIAAQSADNAEAFLEERNNIAKRPRTQARVVWSIPAWTHEHALQTSAGISDLIAEVVGRDGWAAGNSIVIMIRHGSGEGVRVAESFRQGTPTLKVRWEGEMILGSSGLDTYVAGQHATELRGSVPGTAPPTVHVVPNQLAGNVMTHKQCECLDMPWTDSPYEGEGDAQHTGVLSFLQDVHGDYWQTVALRFTGLIIPQKALITSARLIFVADEQPAQPSNEAVTLRISAALTEHAPTFDCSSADGVGRSEGISCSRESTNWITARLGDEGNAWDGLGTQATRPRGRTARSVEWSPGPWIVGSKEATPNLALIIQELVNQNSWSAGNSIALVIEHVHGNGTRRAMAGSARGNPPELEIAWSHNTPATRQVLNAGIGEEMTCNQDRVVLGSSDVEIGQRTDGQNCEQLVGLHFTDIDIANSASISHAFLTFDVDERNGRCHEDVDLQTECAAASAAVTLKVTAVASDDASRIVAHRENLSNRPRTRAEVAWSPDPWTTEHALKRTPDISSVLQEVVDRPGWREGGAILLIVEKVAGNGSRIAETQFATPSITYTMLGGQRGLPPFELLSNAELASERQRAAGEAREEVQQDLNELTAAKADAEDEKKFYYTAAMLCLVVLLVVCTVSCVIKRRLEKRISELESPMLSDNDQEMMAVESMGGKPNQQPASGYAL